MTAYRQNPPRRSSRCKLNALSLNDAQPVLILGLLFLIARSGHLLRRFVDYSTLVVSTEHANCLSQQIFDIVFVSVG